MSDTVRALTQMENLQARVVRAIADMENHLSEYGSHEADMVLTPEAPVSAWATEEAAIRAQEDSVVDEDDED